MGTPVDNRVSAVSGEVAWNLQTILEPLLWDTNLWSVPLTGTKPTFLLLIAVMICSLFKESSLESWLKLWKQVLYIKQNMKDSYVRPNWTYGLLTCQMLKVNGLMWYCHIFQLVSSPKIDSLPWKIYCLCHQVMNTLATFYEYATKSLWR